MKLMEYIIEAHKAFHVWDSHLEIHYFMEFSCGILNFIVEFTFKIHIQVCDSNVYEWQFVNETLNNSLLAFSI